jgi:hypothetical protein
LTIKIQRGRQFANVEFDTANANAADKRKVKGEAVTLFDDKGNAGTFLQKASDKLVAQNITVVVRGAAGKKITLASAADWKTFLDANCATKAKADLFVKNAGITFGDFANIIDDAAASEDKSLTLDLRPTSALAKALSLDKVDGDYAKKLAKDAALNITDTKGAVVGSFTGAGIPTIGKDILTNIIGGESWERDRTEMENWADFKNGGDEKDKFKANTGPAAFAKLYEPKWDDAKSMELVNSFALPLHLEVSTKPPKTPLPPGQANFQDGYEMFRDTYFDDKNGSLEKAGASVRARVRFDNNEPFAVNRVLIQAKEGRAVSGTDSAVHKFEKRWEGNYTDENAAKEQLVTGKDTGAFGGPAPLAVSQKLYKLAQDKRTLPKDGNLQLEEKYVVLQKRRRTHLQLDSLSEVQARQTKLKAEMDALKTAGKPVPPAMDAFGKKLEGQVKFITDATAMLSKYGQYMPSGECFIVSADRYSVYDPTARKNLPPADIDEDDAGRVGKGPLHVEAEWDSAASDPFEKAVAEIDKQIAATLSANTSAMAALVADRAAVEAMRATFRKDVAATVDVIKKQLVSVGLVEDTAKKSKDERAAEIVKTKVDRPVFWK